VTIAILATAACLLLSAPGPGPETLAADPTSEASASDASAVERFRGVALTKDGAVAYVEKHEVHLSGGRVTSAETRYESPDGRPIARLVSEYPPGSFAPDYEFQDLRTGSREAVSNAGNAIRLVDGSRVKVLPVPEDVPLVAGQGLDRYARAHLEELGRGEVLRVSLALPGRLDAFGFQLRGERRKSGRIRVHFEPTSFLLRLLAPSLEGEYDPATRRLVRYVGVSNVAAEDGSPQQVEIAYSYAESSH
jgi:hypothetical protein